MRTLALLLTASLTACAHAKKPVEPGDVAVAPAAPSAARTATAPAAEPGPRERLASLAAKDAVFFEFDQALLPVPELDKLRELAGGLAAVPDAFLTIEGNCDERGTEEYNLVLGQKRAQAAKGYLVALGVAPARIATVTYGEARAYRNDAEELEATPLWALDRRDDFAIRMSAERDVAQAR